MLTNSSYWRQISFGGQINLEPTFKKVTKIRTWLKQSNYKKQYEGVNDLNKKKESEMTERMSPEVPNNAGG